MHLDQSRTTRRQNALEVIRCFSHIGVIVLRQFNNFKVKIYSFFFMAIYNISLGRLARVAFLKPFILVDFKWYLSLFLYRQAVKKTSLLGLP